MTAEKKVNKLKINGHFAGYRRRSHVAVHENVAFDHAVVQLALLVCRPAEGPLELRVAAEHQCPPALRQGFPHLAQHPKE